MALERLGPRYSALRSVSARSASLSRSKDGNVNNNTTVAFSPGQERKKRKNKLDNITTISSYVEQVNRRMSWMVPIAVRLLV